MSDPLVDILDPLTDTAVSAIIVFVRVSPVVALMPAFGERSLPVRAKLAVAFAITFLVTPAAPIAVPAGAADALRLLLAESTTGVLLGLMLRLFILSLQTAGSIAAQSTSLAQLLGPAAAEPIPAMGHVMVVAGIALAVSFGLHVDAVRFLLESYTLFPPGRFPEPSVVSLWGLDQVARGFRLAFALAVPFVIASLIYNLMLGVINRAMPQLMVAFIGAPFTTFGGLALLLLTAPVILKVWQQALFGFLAAPQAGFP